MHRACRADEWWGEESGATKTVTNSTPNVTERFYRLIEQ
jgi:hypothetical protein